MLLKQLIALDVPVAAPSDNIDYIHSLFFASQLHQIPIVENDMYLGLIDAKEFQSIDDAPEEMEPQLYQHFRPAIAISAHPFEALRLLHQYDLSILPVITEQNEYVGSLTKDGLLHYIVENINIDVNGGIVVLEMEPRNYSLAQMARICESEQVLVLGVQAKTNLQTAKLEVTIKTNRVDLAAVVQAFERFDYTVLGTYGDQKMEDDVVDRYNQFMHYLNI
jgi:acetoin utilization protein AcuB